MEGDDIFSKLVWGYGVEAKGFLPTDGMSSLDLGAVLRSSVGMKRGCDFLTDIGGRGLGVYRSL